MLLWGAFKALGLHAVILCPIAAGKSAEIEVPGGGQQRAVSLHIDKAQQICLVEVMKSSKRRQL